MDAIQAVACAHDVLNTVQFHYSIHVRVTSPADIYTFTRLKRLTSMGFYSPRSFRSSCICSTGHVRLLDRCSSTSCFRTHCITASPAFRGRSGGLSTTLPGTYPVQHHVRVILCGKVLSTTASAFIECARVQGLAFNCLGSFAVTGPGVG